MKTIYLSFALLVFSLQSHAARLEDLVFTSRLISTPNAAISVFKDTSITADLDDYKKFLNDAKIPIDKKLPKLTVEDDKLYLEGLNQPIEIRKDGSLSFNGVDLRYRSDLNFQKNRELFDQQWGQFKPFANWKKVSGLSFFVLPLALAEEPMPGGWRTILSQLWVNATLAPRALFAMGAEVQRMRHERSLAIEQMWAGQIKCSPMSYSQNGLVLNFEKESAEKLVMSFTDIRRVPEIIPLTFPITFNKTSDSSGHTRLNIDSKMRSKLQISPPVAPEYIERTMEKTIQICTDHSEAKFNADSLALAKNLKPLSMTGEPPSAPTKPPVSIEGAH